MMKIVDMKVYRKLYLNFLVIICVMIVVSYLLFMNGIYIRWEPSQAKMFKNIILAGIIAVAAIYTFYVRKQKEKLQSISDFGEKISFHQRYFRIRMWWYVLSCSVSCLLYLLVAHTFFLYFALFDLFTMLTQFPNKFFFKRELNDEDIIFL